MGNVMALHPGMNVSDLFLSGPVIGLLAMLLLPVVIWREKVWGWLKKNRPRIKEMLPDMSLKQWHVLIATWFGSGLLRPAPGTMGSIAAIPLGYLIASTGGPIALALAALSLMLIGTPAAHRYGQKTGAVDDQSIVVDEVVGMWIAAIPAENHLDLWLTAFILFRLFDIYKPWPASYYDNRSRSGYDTMMDDVVAGFYAFPGVATIALFYLPT